MAALRAVVVRVPLKAVVLKAAVVLRNARVASAGPRHVVTTATAMAAATVEEVDKRPPSPSRGHRRRSRTPARAHRPRCARRLERLVRPSLAAFLTRQPT